MGQVVSYPLEGWRSLNSYVPPDPKNEYYYARIPEMLDQAGDKYVLLTCHFTLFERLHMLHCMYRRL